MGDIFDVPESTFTPEKWLEVPAVIELESMGTGPANFLTLMLCSLIRETLKINPKYDGDVRHVIFIEEAHNLIGPESDEQTVAYADPKQAATAFVVKMLAEVRALKEGIVIADQLPTVMAQEVLKNTGLKIGLRITSQDDRSLLGSTMAASSMQLEQMATFAVGESLIFYEKLMRPFTMRIKEWWGEIENPAEKEEMVSSKNDSDLRRALSNSDTYKDENLKSIRIIGRKYFRMFSELENKLKPTIYWLQTAISQKQKIEKLYSYLEKVESGEIDDTAKDEKHDQLEKLQSIRENILKEKSKIQEIVNEISTVENWINNLERLKNGRWTRFGAPESELIKITLLQAQMADVLLSIYKRLIGALGVVKEVHIVDKKVDKILLLLKNLNEDLSDYIKIFGTESIMQ